MNGTTILDRIEIDLHNQFVNEVNTIYIDIYDSSLGRKWLTALNHLLKNNYHLEKNYCWFGFLEHNARTGKFILNQVNQSIAAINAANLGYNITDEFSKIGRAHV